MKMKVAFFVWLVASAILVGLDKEMEAICILLMGIYVRVCLDQK
jgi:hypothetical protein